MRPLLVLIHRYVGLAMAGFLAFAGLTGAVLAWDDELDALFFPALRAAPPQTGAVEPPDPLVLREAVAAAFPNAFLAWVELVPPPGDSMRFHLTARPGGPAPREATVFADPWTGEILGARTTGDISQGLKNLMPFIYRLHYSLALEDTGRAAFGFVALVWMLDCLIGAYLTFPASRRNFWRQWGKSWRVRTGNAYKFNFDLHRAGGLWIWAMLFVIAWSAVALNLRPFHDPVLKMLLGQQVQLVVEPLPKPLLSPPIDWHAARKRGRVLMTELARAHRFTLEEERWLGYDPVRGTYRYQVQSSRDVGDSWATTRVVFSALDGRLLEFWAPTGEAAGDTVRTWITALHRAALWGRPFDLFMTGTGLLVVMLSATGVVIWWKKRKTRRSREPLARPPATDRKARPNMSGN